MAHEREGYISTSGLKSEITVVFLDPDFLYDARISAIRPKISVKLRTYFSLRMRETAVFPLPVQSDVTIVFLDPNFL